MGFRPRMQFRVRAGDLHGPGTLGALDAACGALAPGAATHERPLAFAGGIVLALAYEAKNEIERLPQTQREEPTAGRLDAAVYDAVVAYDHRRRRWMVASWHLDDRSLRAYAEEVIDAAALADEADAQGEAARAAAGPPSAGAATGDVLAANLDREEYVGARSSASASYIAAGDVYQVNLAMRFETRLAGTAARRVRAPPRRRSRCRSAPTSTSATTQVLSNSPELFLRRRGERVTTCPDQGHAPARPGRAARTRRSPPSCATIPRSAPSTS